MAHQFTGTKEDTRALHDLINALLNEQGVTPLPGEGIEGNLSQIHTEYHPYARGKKIVAKYEFVKKRDDTAYAITLDLSGLLPTEQNVIETTIRLRLPRVYETNKK